MCRFFAALLYALVASNTFAQSVVVKEPAGSIRFEQYTPTNAPLVLWRLPNPGSSTFPGTTCQSASIPTGDKEKTGRFIAMYLYVKASGEQIFYHIDNATCTIVSFGIDG